MKTVTATAFALLLAAGLAGPTFAANSTNMTPPAGQTQTGDPDGLHMRDQVRDDLTKAGFSDVKVMPESFLVRAKDPKGNPVMMVINPDSFTEVTTISNGANPNAPGANNKMSAAPNAPLPPAK